MQCGCCNFQRLEFLLVLLAPGVARYGGGVQLGVADFRRGVCVFDVLLLVEGEACLCWSGEGGGGAVSCRYMYIGRKDEVL